MKQIKGLLTQTIAAAGIFAAVAASGADEAKAQGIDIIIDGRGIGIQIIPDRAPRYYEQRPRYRDYNEQPHYRQHPSKQNNVRCWNIPKNSPHGGTDRVCNDGYDSRIPTRRAPRFGW